MKTFKSLSFLLYFLTWVLLLPNSLVLGAESKTTKLSKADSDFIKEAAQGGLMEVELGKLAQEKAANDKVKDFGKRMEQDHSKTNDQLKTIANDKGVQISNELDKKHKSTLDSLAKLSGADFDRKYMQDMVSDHKVDVKKFQNQSEKGQDADLKKFASQALPTLKEHLQLAESAERTIKSAGKRTKTSSR